MIWLGILIGVLIAGSIFIIICAATNSTSFAPEPAPRRGHPFDYMGERERYLEKCGKHFDNQMRDSK